MKALPLTATLAALIATGAVAQDYGGRAFARADANGDGRLTRAEISAARASQFRRLDRNGDGYVDQAEIDQIRRRIEMVRGPAGPNQGLGFDLADANGDGRISRAEFIDATPFFARADLNGDGAVTRAEIERLRAARN